MLDRGEMLPQAVRQEMEADLRATFGHVRVHYGLAAHNIAQALGAEAFTISNHVVFQGGRFQPHSHVGRELLRHELAHTLEAGGREDRIYGWFTKALNSGIHTYQLRGQQIRVTVGSGSPVRTHEDITSDALNHISGYGDGAKDILMFWVAEIDAWKTDWHGLSSLANRFPILNDVIFQVHGIGRAVSLLHAYGGPNSPPSAAEIGMTNLDVQHAQLAGAGVIRSFLDHAASVFHFHHSDSVGIDALGVLGISLHTIQDFYSHKVPLRDPDGNDLRHVGLQEGGQHNVSTLEDDPNLDPRRCVMARLRTAEQLTAFVARLQPRAKAALAQMASRRER